MGVLVEVSNLGPLRSAEAELADLTLLIGENNTGKTFFATVAHRALAAQEERGQHWGLGRKSPDEVKEWFEAQAFPQRESPGAAARPPAAVLGWAEEITAARLEGFGAAVRAGVEYAYGADAAQLRRRTPSRRASGCYVRIRNTNPDWQVEVRFDSDEVHVTPPDPTAWVRRLLEDAKADRESEQHRLGHRAPRRPRQLGRLFSDYGGWPVPDHLFSGWPRFPVHLPANRTGFMQSYQVIAGAVVRQSAAAGLRPITVDPLPGTSADFISLLVSDPDDPLWQREPDPRFGALIKDFESELGASFALRERLDAPDAVLAVTPEGEFPLSRASSMLSELAPVILVLKGSLCRSRHITIDEPEAHLHPAMQRRAASFLADVVGRGTRVLVTTHSDFFVGEINNLIRSGELVAPSAPPRRDGSSAARKPTVCALRFSREERWCIGRPLAVDPVDGVDESTFTAVMESLYDDSVQLINESL